MHPAIQKTYNKLERQRNEVRSLIGTLSAEGYRTAPAGQWSVAQVVMHLVTSEELSVSYMKKKALGIERLNDSGIKQSMLLILLRLSQRLPMRYKAPAVIVASTPEAPDLDELLRHWEKCRSDLKTFLETIDPQHAQRLIFKHPIAGMLNVRQAMEFTYEHINHHLPQIKRLLKP